MFAQKKVSLLTVGVGNEVYSIFGHSALRITDSATGSDLVYNYGMFDFSAPNFILNYVRGKLLYFGAAQDFQQFIEGYVQEGRSVHEQVLNINDNEIKGIEDAIAEEQEPKNFYYHYDFCYKNCSTKIRDILSKGLGNKFVYNDYMRNDSITFMDVLNTYLTQQHWLRVGINTILSSKVHHKMSSWHSMFLPKGLMLGLNNATLNGKPIVSSTTLLVPSAQPNNHTTNTARYGLLIIALVLLLVTSIFRKYRIARIIDTVWFTLLGILGLFFLFMWFGTDHVQTNHNLHMLWAVPTHIVWPLWLRSKFRKRYMLTCIVAATLLPTLVHFTVQPIAPEIIPLIVYTIIRLLSYAKNRD